MANQREIIEEPIPLWKLPGDFWANSIILTGAALCASCFGFLAIIAGLARADDSGSNIVAAVAAHALVLVPWGIDIAGIIITVERIHRRKSAFHLWMIGMACMGVNFFLMRWLLSV